METSRRAPHEDVRGLRDKGTVLNRTRETPPPSPRFPRRVNPKMGSAPWSRSGSTRGARVGSRSDPFDRASSFVIRRPDRGAPRVKPSLFITLLSIQLVISPSRFRHPFRGAPPEARSIENTPAHPIPPSWRSRGFGNKGAIRVSD